MGDRHAGIDPVPWHGCRGRDEAHPGRVPAGQAAALPARGVQHHVLLLGQEPGRSARLCGAARSARQAACRRDRLHTARPVPRQRVLQHHHVHKWRAPVTGVPSRPRTPRHPEFPATLQTSSDFRTYILLFYPSPFALLPATSPSRFYSSCRHTDQEVNGPANNRSNSRGPLAGNAEGINEFRCYMSLGRTNVHSHQAPRKTKSGISASYKKYFFMLPSFLFLLINSSFGKR